MQTSALLSDEIVKEASSSKSKETMKTMNRTDISSCGERFEEAKLSVEK